MDREFIVKAINAEIPLKELHELNKNENLNEILQEVYGRRKRFLLDKYVEICIKRLNKEITLEYFVAWLDLIVALLEDRFSILAKRIKDIYYDAWDYDYFEDIHVKKIIHLFKDFDIKKNYKYFINYHQKEKMKVVYMKYYGTFGKDCWDDFYYIAYFVDHKNKKFDIRIISEKKFNYPLDKNISFLDMDEYDILEEDPKILETEHDLHGVIDDYRRVTSLKI